jgi:hypothetical protein
MTNKINPFDLPPEEERKVRIILTNIEWDASPHGHLPPAVSVPVDSSLPEEEMVAKAMDIASAAVGFCISDCDVEPIDYGSPKAEDLGRDSESSTTLEYEGEIF